MDVTCLHCGKQLNAHQCADPDDKSNPKNGDILMCVYCSGLNVIVGDNEIRKADSEEQMLANMFMMGVKK